MRITDEQMNNAVTVIKLAASTSADVAAAVKEGRKSIGPVVKALILADRAAAEAAAATDQPNQAELPNLTLLVASVMDGLAKDSRRKARQYLNSMLAASHKSIAKASMELGQMPPPKVAVYGETDGKLWAGVQPVKRLTSDDAKAAALKAIAALRDALADVSDVCTDADAKIVSDELNAMLAGVTDRAERLAEAA